MAIGRSAARDAGGIEQLEEQRGGGGVSEHGPPHRDLFAVFEHNRHRSTAPDNDSSRARSQAQASAMAREQSYERFRDGLRSALRHGIASRAGGESQHVAEAGTEAVVGSHIDVQRETWQHAPRRL